MTKVLRLFVKCFDFFVRPWLEVLWHVGCFFFVDLRIVFAAGFAYYLHRKGILEGIKDKSIGAFYHVWGKIMRILAPMYTGPLATLWVSHRFYTFLHDLLVNFPRKAENWCWRQVALPSKILLGMPLTALRDWIYWDVPWFYKLVVRPVFFCFGVFDNAFYRPFKVLPLGFRVACRYRWRRYKEGGFKL